MPQNFRVWKFLPKKWVIAMVLASTWELTTKIIISAKELSCEEQWRTRRNYCACVTFDGQRSGWKDPWSCLHTLEVWRNTRIVGELFLLLPLSSSSPSFLLPDIVRTTLLHWKVLLDRCCIFYFIVLNSQVSSHLWCWSALLIADYVAGINAC